MTITVTHFCVALILAALSCLVISYDEKKVGRRFSVRTLVFMLAFLVPWWLGAIVVFLSCERTAWHWILLGWRIA